MYTNYCNIHGKYGYLEECPKCAAESASCSKEILLKSQGLYRATITFTLAIEADNMDVAEYLANQAIPKHLSNSTAGKIGCGTAKFEAHEKVIVRTVR